MPTRWIRTRELIALVRQAGVPMTDSWLRGMVRNYKLPDPRREPLGREFLWPISAVAAVVATARAGRKMKRLEEAPQPAAAER